MFGSEDFDVVDSIEIGTGTKLRLVKSPKGKKRIEVWSSLSKQWNVMYRYDVDKAWESWKKVEKGIEERKVQAKPVAKPKKQPKKATAKPKTPRKPRAKAETKEVAPKPKAPRKPRKKKDA